MLPKTGLNITPESFNNPQYPGVMSVYYEQLPLYSHIYVGFNIVIVNLKSINLNYNQSVCNSYLVFFLKYNLLLGLGTFCLVVGVGCFWRTETTSGVEL